MDLQAMLAGIESNPALQDLAGQAGVQPGQAQDMLHGILDHLVSTGGLEGAAEAVAGRVGIEPAQVQQYLPMALALLQSHAQTAPGGAQGELGGLLGSLQSSPFGALLSGGAGDQAGGGLAGLAKGLFGGQS